jgi:predicted phosphodiesterase
MGSESSGPLAVISCVHGNLAALDAVLRDIDEQRIEQVVCLGDLVGYGPFPNQVVERLRERCIPVVQGCWDEGIGKGTGHCGCSFPTPADAQLGELAYLWTDLEITAETRAYLAALPPLLGRHAVAGLLAFVHGSPASNAEYLQDSTHELVLLERASRTGCDVMFCGHTHVPFIKWVGGELSVTSGEASEPSVDARRVQLRPKLIINAGSVGEPRHGGPEATYVVFDQDSRRTLIREVAYDVQHTLRALAAADLPREFGERLAVGAELVPKRKHISCSC